MSDYRTLPMPGSPTFSCELEMMLWLVRHQDDPFVVFWWIGFEMAAAGRSWDRVKWKLAHGV